MCSLVELQQAEVFDESRFFCFLLPGSVPPTISMWLEHKYNKMVAVCRAAGGKPAANISWSHAGNSLSVETNSHGFLTVESRLELPEGMDTENLSCVVRHQYWEGERIVKLPKGQAFAKWISHFMYFD